MGIQKMIYCLSLLGCISAGWYVFSLLQQPIGDEHVYVEHDYSLTHEAHCEIKSFIKRAVASLAGHEIIPALKKEFPFLLECRMRMIAPHVCHIAYVAQQPLACIGSTHCITHQGSLVPAELYCPSKRDSLACIQTALTPEAIANTQPILSFIHRSYSQISSNYTVEYKGEHEFLLHDQVNKNSSILASADTIFTEKLLQAANTVFIQKNDQTRTAQNKNTQWIVDVRFDNQIILYEHKKGGNVYV